RRETARSQQAGDRRARPRPFGIDAAPPRELVELDDPGGELAEGAGFEIGGRRAHGAVDVTKVDARRPRPWRGRGTVRLRCAQCAQRSVNRRTLTTSSTADATRTAPGPPSTRSRAAPSRSTYSTTCRA